MDDFSISLDDIKKDIDKNKGTDKLNNTNPSQNNNEKTEVTELDLHMINDKEKKIESNKELNKNDKEIREIENSEDVSFVHGLYKA